VPCPQCQSDKTIRRPSGPHIGEYCEECHRFIRWVPQGLENFIWPIGTKHKGKKILDILRDDRDYLVWAAENISMPNLKKKAQEALNKSGGTHTTLRVTGSIQPAPKLFKAPSEEEALPWD